jgi:hypothetical protein
MNLFMSITPTTPPSHYYRYQITLPHYIAPSRLNTTPPRSHHTTSLHRNHASSQHHNYHTITITTHKITPPPHHNHNHTTITITPQSQSHHNHTTTTTGAEDPSKMIIHAYGAGNEDWSQWNTKEDKLNNKNIHNDESQSSQPSQPSQPLSPSQAYKEKKEKAADFLYRSVSRALDIPESEVRERSDVTMIGSPYTHMVGESAAKSLCNSCEITAH